MWKQTFIILSFATACAAPGSAIEKRPLSKPLSGYASAALILTAADPSATNAAKKISSCKNALETKLNSGRVFGSLMSETEAALLLKASLTDTTQSALGIESSEKTITIDVDLVDAKDQQSIGAIELTGTSKTGSTTTVGGVNMDAFEDLYKRACEVAGDRLNELLTQRK